ncbi:hypothetical protein E2C01_058346 [Portunus trituberculatus]|uniref:Uncharacterized protein n=1 Tax=Portunus trituberculatus TaxID=210409 RepID=A0A5B7H3H5_PORTR|nr:hypothetical protein [Portunus trituberculatus]
MCQKDIAEVIIKVREDYLHTIDTSPKITFLSLTPLHLLTLPCLSFPLGSVSNQLGTINECHSGDPDRQAVTTHR